MLKLAGQKGREKARLSFENKWVTLRNEAIIPFVLVTNWKLGAYRSSQERIMTVSKWRQLRVTCSLTLPSLSCC